MNRVIMRWLEGHGLPGWLAPSYMMTVALAGFLGSIAFFRLVRRDKADPVIEGRALLFGYLAALAGGYVLEGIRAVPEAIASGSISPFFHVGRAAYGGLIAGVLVPVFVLRRHGLPVRPFLDRLIPVLGITYASVRTGCFLAGCDYGRVTGGSLGVRFPVGSPAAVDHAGLGWVPAGTPSLPVHATQLYEAGLGAVASGVAAIWLVRGHRDGRAFCTWLGVYAVGRFLIEFIRGDRSRGIYGGLSSAQFISIAILVGIAAALLWARRNHNNNNNNNNNDNRLAPALGALLGISLIAGGAEAQPSSPPAPTSTSSAAPAPPPPAPSASAPRPAPAASGSAAVPAPPPPAWPSVQPQPAPAPAPTYAPPQQPAPQQPYPYPYPYPQPYPQQPYPYPYPQQPYPYPQQPYPYPQQPYPYPQQPYPYPPPAATTPYYPQPTTPAPRPIEPDVTTPPPEEPPEPEPKVTDQKEANKRRLAVTLGLSGYFVPARFTVQNGGALDLDVITRLKLSDKNRFEIGVGLRGGTTTDTKLYSVGVPLRFQFGVGRNLEMSLGAVPAFYLLSFDSPYFASAAAFGVRLSWGIQFPIGSHFVFGFSPVSFLVLASPDVDTVFAYDPSFWVGAAFF